MRLLLLRPELANRDCQFCQKYAHHDDGPVFVRQFPVLRHKRQPAPCRTSKGCPKGTPEQPKSLSAANLLCYRHYQRCKATGRWPKDPLVSYHARVIAEIERECEQASLLRMLQSLGPNSGV